MFSFEQKLTEDFNKKLYEYIIAEFSTKQQRNVLAADVDRRLYYEYAVDKKVQHFGECDFNSVMMYPQLTRAVTKLKNDKSMPWPGTLKFTAGAMATRTLSKGDVAGILALYPK